MGFFLKMIKEPSRLYSSHAPLLSHSLSSLSFSRLPLFSLTLTLLSQPSSDLRLQPNNNLRRICAFNPTTTFIGSETSYLRLQPSSDCSFFVSFWFWNIGSETSFSPESDLRLQPRRVNNRRAHFRFFFFIFVYFSFIFVLFFVHFSLIFVRSLAAIEKNGEDRVNNFRSIILGVFFIFFIFVYFLFIFFPFWFSFSGY